MVYYCLEASDISFGICFFSRRQNVEYHFPVFCFPRLNLLSRIRQEFIVVINIINRVCSIVDAVNKHFTCFNVDNGIVGVRVRTAEIVQQIVQSYHNNHRQLPPPKRGGL